MASALAAFKRDEGSISDHFLCPICLELPTQKVFQCKKGHPLCEACHSKCKECPNCRVPFDKTEPIRNLYFEGLLDTVVTVDCAYKGCQFHPTRNLVQDHQSKCHFNIEKFGDLIEVCKRIGYRACDFCFNNGNILDAVKHLVHVHGCISTEGDHLQMELVGFQEATDSNVNCFWTPVISDLKERNYFILTFACLDLKSGCLTCFSMTMPKLNEFEETIKIEYSLSDKNNKSLEWGIIQNAKHFSKVIKVGPLSAKDSPWGFSLQQLKLHILENGSLLLNIRVHEIMAKNSSKAIEKKANRIVCEKRVILPTAFPLACESVDGCEDPTEIIVEKLPDSVTKDYVKTIFRKFGEIRSINMFQHGPNTCLIDFVDKDSVKKVIEKKRRIFMKKNGKKYRLDVFISHQGEPVANKGNGDAPFNMALSQSTIKDLSNNLEDWLKMDRDALMDQIEKIFSNSRAWTDEIQYNLLKKGVFFTAAVSGNVESVQYCIGKGIDVNKLSEDDDAVSAIAYTMLDKDKKIGLEKAKLLIENGANVNFKDSLGRSLLHHSVHSGSDDAVKFFLEKGLEVNAMNKAGETPLHVALYNTGIRFLIQKVKLLLDHGADLNIKDNKGQSCLNLVKEAPFEYWDQLESLFKKHQEQGNTVLEEEN